ncbi:GNAT family N-acetyltransferase [Vallitalea okinawensis]|uniref:GNAT family N-acetyltransferase n=1 Tax=Vallitalea okinawensis TaxID=2078660 RepID=UPI000CFB02B3|nr:GNAT family N-acetyltransferase [Vallitalea okinawensis]
MRLKLFRTISDEKIAVNSSYIIINHDKQPDNLYQFLFDRLDRGRVDSDDPVMMNNSPDKFISRILSGHLGDKKSIRIYEALDIDQSVGVLVGLNDHEDNRLFHIYSLVVFKEYRRNGIGRDLLGCCLNDLIETTYREVTIDVYDKNWGAVNLYKQLGFFEKKSS